MKTKQIAVFAAVAVVAVAAGVSYVLATSAPKTRAFELSIGHQDAFARPALIESGAPGETNISTFYRWQPPVITVFKGDRVVLNVVNEAGSRVHSLTLPDFGVYTGNILPKQAAPDKKDRTVTLEFVADRAGVFQWACDTPHDPDEDPQLCSADHKYQVGWLVVLEK